MPKNNATETVLHDWILELPFQQQALLLTGVRGPDGCPKHDSAKKVVRYLRGVVVKAAGYWNGLNNNDWCWGEQLKFSNCAGDFILEHDQYPHHFIMHLVHCAEVIGYKHPDQQVRKNWLWFYQSMCISFHMHPETEKEMDDRLNDVFD